MKKKTTKCNSNIAFRNSKDILRHTHNNSNKDILCLCVYYYKKENQGISGNKIKIKRGMFAMRRGEVEGMRRKKIYWEKSIIFVAVALAIVSLFGNITYSLK